MGAQASVEFEIMKAMVFSSHTSHMGIVTRKALADIAETTLRSLSAFERHEPLVHEIGPGGSGVGER